MWFYYGRIDHVVGDDGGAMMYEFDRDVHVHRIGNRIIPGATDILKDAGFSFPQGNMEMGKGIHLATELDDRGELDESTVSDDIYSYLIGWRKFRADTGFQPTRIEEPNVNVALGFATVLDREGTWSAGKARVLVEIKKYDPPFFTGLQLALQDLTLPQLMLPRERISVQLTPFGGYVIHPFKNKNDRSLAMALVSLYWFKRNGGC